MPDALGRSPFRARQLHDLRLQPTADDPRPVFVWSAESDRNAAPEPWQEYPKLMWAKDNPKDEITVHSREEEDLQAQVYTTRSPYLDNQVVDPMDAIRDELDSLTEEERAFVVKEQQAQRMRGLQDRMSKLSPDALERLLNKADDRPKRGRPRKTV